MALTEQVVDSSFTERLSYVRILLSLMEGREDLERRALAGGAAIWLAAIDETLVELNPTVRGVRYKDRRTSEVGGRTLRGLRLARNEIAHGTALVTQSGLRFPARFPLKFYLRFISVEDLAANNRSRQGKELRAFDLSLYRDYVAGKRIEGVLKSCYDWLLRAVRSLE